MNHYVSLSLTKMKSSVHSVLPPHCTKDVYTTQGSTRDLWTVAICRMWSQLHSPEFCDLYWLNSYISRLLLTHFYWLTVEFLTFLDRDFERHLLSAITLTVVCAHMGTLHSQWQLTLLYCGLSQACKLCCSGELCIWSNRDLAI